MENALRAMKNGKAPSHDDVHAEARELMDPRILTDLFNEIYKTGQISKDWMKSTFVSLPKKNQARSCRDYTLISFISHALKILLRFLHAHLYFKYEE